MNEKTEESFDTPSKHSITEAVRVVVDSLENGAKKSVRRIQLEIGLAITILLAIFGLLLKNSIELAELRQQMLDHSAYDDERTRALADGISLLTETDEEILILLEGYKVRQESNLERIRINETQLRALN